MSDAPVQHVSDTAFLVAHFRAIESARPDALFHDPLAARLAGERGRRIAEGMPNPMSGWQTAMRTVVIDRFLLEAIAGGAQCVLNLGAGLDTRPYRLELPRTLRWIEVDYPAVQALKESVLAGEAAACSVERIGLDLADLAARQQLFSRIASESTSVIVLTEGVIPYLAVEDAGALADDLRSMRSVTGWIADYLSPELVRFRRSSQADFAKAPFLFEPPDWHAFFAAHGWSQRAIRYLADQATESHRPPMVPPAAAMSEGFRTSMGYALLTPTR